MKSIAYLPGLSFTHNFYIKEIKDNYNYYIFSTSPKSKFTINQNGKYIFSPMPFKILSRVLKTSYPIYYKSIDMNIYNYITSKFPKKFDIYHCNACFGYGTFKVIKKNSNLKILEEQNSHTQFCNNLLIKEYKNFGIQYEFDKKIVEKRLEEYNLADKILVPSLYSQDSFLKMGIDKKKLFRNMLVQDKYLEAKKKQKIDRDKIVFGFIGGNVIMKGLIYLLKALSKINYDYELHMTLNKSHLNNFDIFNDFIDNKMKFLGNFSNMDEFYKNIDILVAPSINDGYSMVVVEALSRSIPVIVSNNVGASEIITQDFGYKFISANQEELNYILNERVNRNIINNFNDKIYNNFYKIRNYFQNSKKNIENLYS